MGDTHLPANLELKWCTGHCNSLLHAQSSFCTFCGDENDFGPSTILNARIGLLLLQPWFIDLPSSIRHLPDGPVEQVLRASLKATAHLRWNACRQEMDSLLAELDPPSIGTRTLLFEICHQLSTNEVDPSKLVRFDKTKVLGIDSKSSFHTTEPSPFLIKQTEIPSEVTRHWTLSSVKHGLFSDEEKDFLNKILLYEQQRNLACLGSHQREDAAQALKFTSEVFEADGLNNLPISDWALKLKSINIDWYFLNSLALCTAAEKLIFLKRFQDALTVLAHASRQLRFHPEARNKIGGKPDKLAAAVYEEMGEFEKAREFLLLGEHFLNVETVLNAPDEGYLVLGRLAFLLLMEEDFHRAQQCYSIYLPFGASENLYAGCALIGDKQFDKAAELIRSLCDEHENSKSHVETTIDQVDFRSEEFHLEDLTRCIRELRCRLSWSTGDSASTRFFAKQALDSFEQLLQTLRAEEMSTVANIDLFADYAKELLRFLKFLDGIVTSCWKSAEDIRTKIACTRQAYENIMSSRHEGISIVEQMTGLNELADLKTEMSKPGN